MIHDLLRACKCLTERGLVSAAGTEVQLVLKAQRLSLVEQAQRFSLVSTAAQRFSLVSAAALTTAFKCITEYIALYEDTCSSMRTHVVVYAHTTYIVV